MYECINVISDNYVCNPKVLAPVCVSQLETLMAVFKLAEIPVVVFVS